MTTNFVLTLANAQTLKVSLETLLLAYGNGETVMHRLRDNFSSKILNMGKARKAGDGHDLNLATTGVLDILNPSRRMFNETPGLFSSIIIYLDAVLNKKKEESSAAAFAITSPPSSRGGRKLYSVPRAFGNLETPSMVVDYCLSQLMMSGALAAELENMPTPVRLSNPHKPALLPRPHMPEALPVDKNQRAKSLPESVPVQNEKPVSEREKAAFEKGVQLLLQTSRFTSAHSIHLVISLLLETPPEDIFEALLKEKFTNPDTLRSTVLDTIIEDVFNALLQKEGYAFLSPKKVEANCGLISVDALSRTIRLRRSGQYRGMGVKNRVSLLIAHMRWFLIYVGTQALKNAPVPSETIVTPQGVKQVKETVTKSDSEGLRETIARSSQHSIEGMLTTGDVLAEWIGSTLTVSTLPARQPLSPSAAGLEEHFHAIASLFSQLRDENALWSEEVDELKANTTTDIRRLQAELIELQLQLQTAQEKVESYQGFISPEELQTQYISREKLQQKLFGDL